MHARYLEDHGDRIVLAASPLDQLARGTQLAFVAAPIALISGSVAAWVMATSDFAFFVGWGISALFSGNLALLGFHRMATAGRARRVRFRIDRAERVLERPDRTVEVLRGVEAVRVRARRWAGFVLELVHDDERVTPLLEVPRGRGSELADAALRLAHLLDADAEIATSAERDRPLLPRDHRVASALAYVPIDGFAQAMAVYYLMSASDPFVRFNAKMSLAMVPLEALGALLSAGVGLLLAMLLPEHTSAAFAFPLILFAGVRATIRTIAAMRAHRSIVWVQPWLAPVARRWAPPRAQPSMRSDAR